MPTIRASKMSLSLVCPESLSPMPYALSAEGAPARLGTAVHEWMGMAIKDYNKACQQFKLIAGKYRVKEDDLRYLAFTGYDLWKKIKHLFDNPQLETYYEHDSFGLKTTGHLDVHEIKQRRMPLVDFKSGYLFDDWSDQMKTYGELGIHNNPDVEEIDCYILHFRDKVIVHEVWTREEIEQWYQVAKARVSEPAYNPGQHCIYCDRRNSCQAFRDYAASSLAILQKELSANSPATLYDAIKTVKDIQEEAHDWLKLYVTENGPVVYDATHELRIESEARKEIDFAKAYKTLMEALEPEELAQVIKISNKELEKIVKAKTGNGNKKAAFVHLLEMLDLNDAVSVKFIEKLMKKKTATERIVC